MKIKEIKEKVAYLKKKDPFLKLFGATNHKYDFNKTISFEEVDIFQKKYNIILPSEYVEFLTCVGNGGAGPNYGLLSIHESLYDFKLHDKPLIDITKPFVFSQQWNDSWVLDLDLENERPNLDVLEKYLDVST